jgi:hypothetical protein
MAPHPTPLPQERERGIADARRWARGTDMVEIRARSSVGAQENSYGERPYFLGCLPLSL